MGRGKRIAGIAAVLVALLGAASAGFGARAFGVPPGGPAPAARTPSVPATPRPAVVVAKAGQTRGIALDDTHVYWTNDSQVARAKKSGGPVQVLARDQGKPFGIAVHEGYVYWTTLTGDTVARVKTGGGKVEILARQQNLASALAIDAKRGLVLWLTEVHDDEDLVASVPLAGGETTVLARVAGATGLATDGDFFYVASSEGYVMQVPLPTGEGRMLLENEPVGYDVAVGPGAVWLAPETLGEGTSIVRLPLDGSPPQILARKLDAVFSTAFAGDAFWWTTRETGCVYRIAAAGGQPVLVASGQDQPRALRADATHVYWANSGKGTIARLAR